MSRHSIEAPIVDTVTIPLEAEDCPDFIADELLLWCRRRGLRVRRMDRAQHDVVRFGFQYHEHGIEFRKVCGLLAR